jgi:hypothetical protein
MKLAKFIFILLFLLFFTFAAKAQTEVLSNPVVIEMTKTGLSKEIILGKIKSSEANFDVSASALIELRKAGVENEIISAMLEKAENSKNSQSKSDAPAQNYSESQPFDGTQIVSNAAVSPKQALLSAKTVAIEKSSLNPSRQALEKALFKRKDWNRYNLAIVRYKESADLYIEIGRIPFTWLSHRYVFRIYDRRSGTIITAGETTSWGDLASNLAREITQKLDKISSN